MAAKAKSCLFHQLYDFGTRYNSTWLYSNVYTGSQNFTIVAGTRSGGKFTTLTDAFTALGFDNEGDGTHGPEPSLYQPYDKKTIVNFIHGFKGFKINATYSYNGSVTLEDFNDTLNANFSMNFSSDRILSSQNFQNRLSYAGAFYEIVGEEIFSNLHAEVYNDGYDMTSAAFNSNSKFLSKRMGAVDPITMKILENSVFSEEDTTKFMFFDLRTPATDASSSSAQSKIQEIDVNINSYSSHFSPQKLFGININFTRPIIEINNSFYVILSIDYSQNDNQLFSLEPTSAGLLTNHKLEDVTNPEYFEATQIDIPNLGSFGIYKSTKNSYSVLSQYAELGVAGSAQTNWNFNIELEKFENSDFAPDNNYPTPIG